MFRPSLLLRLTFAGAILASTTSALAVVPNEQPQPGYTVEINTTDDHDDGVCGLTDCTLREAINAANTLEGAHFINFAPRVFGSRKTTIVLKSDLPVIRAGLNLTGPYTPGAGVTIENRNPTSGSVLRIESGAPFINYLTLKGYNALYNSSPGDGISLQINACTFIGRNIGIANEGSISLLNCTITGSQNAGILNTRDMLIDHCTITGNKKGLVTEGSVTGEVNSLIVGNNTNVSADPLSPDQSPFPLGVSITTGTAAEAGLEVDGQGNAVLKDNGGPTPTIALLPTSLAINAGWTIFSRASTDQRFVYRDTKPDIGAYEVPTKTNQPPSIISYSPTNASDKVGTKRTFSLDAFDYNGVTDIKEVWLMVNERQSWNGGATLIYVPSATSPTSGLLYLRTSDGLSFLPPVQVGEGASNNAFLANDSVIVAARDVKVTYVPNRLTVSIPITVRDGLVGLNRIYGRVVDKRGAVTYLTENGYRNLSLYTVQPQFAGETNNAPTLSKLTPTNTNTALDSAGLGPVQQFSFYAVDPDGTGDIDTVWFMANKALGWKNSATFVYTARNRRLYLRSDDGNSFLGGGIIGTPGIIENSQVRVDLSKVRVLTYGDGKTLGFILPLQAKRGLLGQNKIWLRVEDRQRATAPNGDAQGYVQSGTWNVGQGTTPRSTNSLSASGS